MYTGKTIAIDYDDTYTLDPFMWNKIIHILHYHGWKIYIVTYRDSTQFNDVVIINHIDDYIYTSGKAKKKYCEECGINIDVWVDDSPEAIVYDWKDLPIL